MCTPKKVKKSSSSATKISTAGTSSENSDKKICKKEQQPGTIDTYNLNRDTEIKYTPAALNPILPHPNESIKLNLKASKSTQDIPEIPTMVDEIPIAAEEVVVEEEVVIETVQSTNSSDQSPDFHLSIQSSSPPPYAAEAEIVTESIVPFCSQTAP